MNAKPDVNKSRDLYVAFAFAAADLLLEVEQDGSIGFAVGAARALSSHSAQDLTGMPLEGLFVGEEAHRIRRALLRIDNGELVRHLLVHSLGAEGTKRQTLALAGYRHPQRPGARLVALTHAAALEPPADAHDPVSGMLDAEDFSRMARTMLAESAAAGPDQAYKLTLLEIPQVEEVRAKAGALAADDFMAELGAKLKSVSVGGDAVGELGDNKFGVIHDPSTSDKDIEGQINTLLQSFLPGGEILPMTSVSMDLDGSGISSEEAANALLYTLNAFSQGGPMTLDRLANDIRPKLTETVAQIREVKGLIESGAFELVFQPIVDMWTDVVHHFECLVRFPGKDSPFETVTFAENVGIVGGLDLAILRRAVEYMRSPLGNHQALRFAVNLSGRSLSHPETAKQLMDIVSHITDLKGRLLFELTESAEVDDLPSVNGVLQSLRKAGFPVCLDDFGAGSAAFHYLRALKVDHVKIDGAYVKEIAKSGEATPYLRAISGLCSELKIGTIAEYVENAEATNILKLLKVRYGQGWHFGKPMQPRSDQVQPLRGWAHNNLFWQNGLLVFRKT